MTLLVESTQNQMKRLAVQFPAVKYSLYLTKKTSQVAMRILCSKNN